MSSAPNITKVTERGQVSIPARLRSEMALEQGRRLRWEKVSDQELRVTVVEGKPEGPQAMRGFACRFREPRRTADWMKELREGES